MPDVDVAMTYLDFVENRHRVWVRRLGGYPPPWTDDPILRARKFTNVFRILDPGTQFLMRDGFLEGEPRDVLMRCFLYRHTGRVEAWEHLRGTLGDWPVTEDLPLVRDVWRSYRPVFTGAYLVYPQSSTPGTNKVFSILDLTERLFATGDVPEDFLTAKTQADRFAVLRRNKGVADFMSMQVLTDWGYSDHCGEDREDEFVVLGPGAVRGAQALDRDGLPAEALRWAVEAVRTSPSCPVLPNGRVPSHMDIQNTLCEFSKYVRFATKPLSDKGYVPAHPGKQQPPVLPKHW